MNIVETSIPDIDVKNIDKSKLYLAEKIVEGIHPLLDDVYREKMKQLEELKGGYKVLRQRIHKEKRELEQLMAEHKRKRMVKNLVERISKLVSTGLVHEGAMRNQMVVLLKIVDNLSEEKLNHQLREITNMVSKRFAKV
jgi:deoxyadenosine/deoxycytidine kinase